MGYKILKNNKPYNNYVYATLQEAVEGVRSLISEHEQYSYLVDAEESGYYDMLSDDLILPDNFDYEFYKNHNRINIEEYYSIIKVSKDVENEE